jgi:hypothetical protein
MHILADRWNSHGTGFGASGFFSSKSSEERLQHRFLLTDKQVDDGEHEGQWLRA